MLKSEYSSYTQLLFPCHMCVNIHELRHMVDTWSHLFVYSLGKIINNIKPLSWSLGKYEPVLIHRKMAGCLGGRKWLTGLWVILPWTPLFTVKVRGSRTWGAAMAVTMPRAVMYKKVRPPGTMNLVWPMYLIWVSTLSLFKAIRPVRVVGVISVTESLVYSECLRYPGHQWATQVALFSSCQNVRHFHGLWAPESSTST